MLDLELYKKLVNMNGISGREHEIKKFVKEELMKCSDEIIEDKLGSVVGVSKGNGPKIMFLGHMDEVGFMVSNISDKGFIYIMPVGGIKPEVYVSQNMQIVVNSQKTIKGIIGAIPPHLSKEARPVMMEDLVLDIGADSKEEAINMGVKVGQQVVSTNEFYFTEDGKKIVSKAWDNRFGTGLAIEIMRYAYSKKHPNTVYCGASVQEEVGCRGAQTITNIVAPDAFFAFDVTTATDCMPYNPRTGSKLGGGFIVRVMDPGCIMGEGLHDYLIDLATKHNISYQEFMPSGGTDAGKAQFNNGGSISTCLAICGRYIHSTATMVHVDDMEAVKKLAMAIVDDLDQNRLNEILEKL